MVKNYYNEIKKELHNNEVYKKIKDYSKNGHDLSTYYNVGKLLIDAQGGETRAKYGNELIKKYSIKLTNELDKKYSTTSLKYMRQFYIFKKSHAVRDQSLSWNHYKKLLPLKDINQINYYINISINQSLSYRELEKRIKSKEYERLPNNTKNKLINLNNKDKYEITDFIKNPIIIENTKKYNEITEKNLQDLILENMPLFLKQLGDGFAFIENEYKIKTNNDYNYIDLLLCNIKYNCYVVVELKVTKLKKEHLGQIQVYMNYIDKNLKTINQNDTIGIIICKEDDKFVMKYCSNNKITNTKYITV